jgi:hypothetical protein
VERCSHDNATASCSALSEGRLPVSIVKAFYSYLLSYHVASTSGSLGMSVTLMGVSSVKPWNAEWQGFCFGFGDPEFKCQHDCWLF